VEKIHLYSSFSERDDVRLDHGPPSLSYEGRVENHPLSGGKVCRESRVEISFVEQCDGLWKLIGCPALSLG
jgi:hypothetical protein